MRSASDFSCSARSAVSAALRWLAKEARSVKATAPAPMTFNASIVLVNQTGRSASGKNTSPAMPVRRKTTHERDEPADGLTHLEEDEGSERSQDAPQPDPSGRKEPADEHLPGGRRQAGCRGVA